jgi:hypothetical protein
MRCLFAILIVGLLTHCAGCGGETSSQSTTQGSGSAAPVQPSPATFNGIGTGYQASDPR